jgi:formylglycine-generating enzyme required for sulfatase activity
VDSSELVQKLRKGHHDVKLTAEEWDRIVTWVDLNAPYHGDWGTIAGNNAVTREKRRAEMRKVYAGVDDYQIDAALTCSPLTSFLPEVPAPKATAIPTVTPSSAPNREPKTVDLGDGVKMTFVFVPAGEFVMGSGVSEPDEQPVSKVTIARGYWMATTEITNRQFACFDPKHDSRREDKQGYQFGVEGYPLFTPDQPVVRVSWREAMAFSKWLAAKTGAKVMLPTEAQWEYACRAGTSTPFSYGDLNTDFSKQANMADRTTKELASDPYTQDRPIPNPPEFDDWVPKDERFNDGALVTCAVGHYQPNPWGLCDMHGNAAEWTRSEYRAYPYVDDDGRNGTEGDAPRVVRGGSWRDRPERCTSSYRYAYRPYQPVFNVSFRVIIEE